jgi:hypothetical protein
VADLEGQSNGLVVSTWQVAIVDGAIPGGAPLRFEADEYGPGSIRPEGLLVTKWEDEDDPVRGPGKYLVGRPFCYHRGSLIPDAHRKAVHRRLLHSFEMERSRYLSERGDERPGQGNPEGWLAESRVEQVVEKPAPPSGRMGRIKSVAAVEGELSIQFEVPGQPAPLTIPERSGQTRLTLRLADAATGRLYPEGYMPTEPDRLLQGRQASLTTSQYGQTLWLQGRDGECR